MGNIDQRLNGLHDGSSPGLCDKWMLLLYMSLNVLWHDGILTLAANHGLMLGPLDEQLLPLRHFSTVCDG